MDDEPVDPTAPANGISSQALNRGPWRRDGKNTEAAGGGSDAEDHFKDFPGIDAGAAQWLIRRKIIMLGLDLPSVHPKEYKKVHEMLFRGGVAVTEGLIN